MDKGYNLNERQLGKTPLKIIYCIVELVPNFFNSSNNDRIDIPLALSRQTHPDPDPYYRNEKYEQREYLLPVSFGDLPYTETESLAEQAEIRRMLERVSNPTFVPIDRTAPLCYCFVPDEVRDASLLSKCASRKTPEALFVPQKNRSSIVQQRYIHARNRGMLLLQTDGACSNNGQTQPRAGIAYVYAPPNPLKPDEKGVIASKLLSEDATSNRAELLAVITALRTRFWMGEGFHTIVFATDSEYVVKGCTEWCRTWEARGWRNSAGQKVKNRDLWEELIWNIEWVRHRGCKILLWQIPREWNGKADAAAKGAAAETDN